jgi:hypothetical protein
MCLELPSKASHAFPSSRAREVKEWVLKIFPPAERAFTLFMETVFWRYQAILGQKKAF